MTIYTRPVILGSLSLLITLVGSHYCFGQAKITFLDVGQGDASVIQVSQANGEPFTIVVDGGDGDSDLKDNLPALLSQDPTIELVVLSHPHKDHVGALDWLAGTTITIGQVWWTDENFSEGNYDRFRQRLQARGIPAQRPTEAVHSFPGFSNFRLRVFNNGQEFVGTQGSDINNDSLVFQLMYEPSPAVRVTALFTGDIEQEEGRRLVTQFGQQLKSDIVKVPHHGSDALFPQFPSEVAARFAFVSSSGTHGTFKHPRKEALDLYDATARVSCTCDAARKKVSFTVVLSQQGGISVSPTQPPYFVWERQSNGTLKRVTVQ